VNPRVSTRISQVLDNLLAKDPAERYQSVRELSEDLARIDRGEPVGARSRQQSPEPVGEKEIAPDLLKASRNFKKPRGRRLHSFTLPVMAAACGLAALIVTFLAGTYVKQEPPFRCKQVETSLGLERVILRWERRDQNPPLPDLTEAAVLAALHSEARHSSVVAVDWTRRKYVRKPRKAAAGSVIPERVSTLFVEPDTAVRERLSRDD